MELETHQESVDLKSSQSFRKPVHHSPLRIPVGAERSRAVVRVRVSHYNIVEGCDGLALCRVVSVLDDVRGEASCSNELVRDWDGIASAGAADTVHDSLASSTSLLIAWLAEVATTSQCRVGSLESRDWELAYCLTRWGDKTELVLTTRCSRQHRSRCRW